MLFSAFVKAFNVTSEFSSNLLSSLSEISSHGGLSLFVSFFSLLEFLTGSLEESRISFFKVSNISLVFLGKSLFGWFWEFCEIGSTSGFVLNAIFHNLMSLFVPFSSENISINTLSGDFFVAVSRNGELIEESDVILSNWFVVFSEDDVFSNFV